MINIKNMYKSFGSNKIIKGIDVQVKKGETVVIIGPSGSGKTTLLRCMNLLEIPDSGVIEIGSSRLVFDDNNKPAKSDIVNLHKQTGMVFQEFNLFPHQTVIENIMEGQITVLKRSKSEARSVGIQLLEKVGLADKNNSFPFQLSGGQQQRVAIARAMAMDPSVLLFDEPTSALDPELAAEVLQVMQDLSREGMTMVVVTHKMSFARDVANKVIFLDGGQILEEGTAQHIFKDADNPRIKQFLSMLND